MSKRISLLVAVFFCIAALPSPADAGPDFSFTVPVKITNLPKGYAPYVLCRVKEYTKVSKMKVIENAHGSQTFTPDAGGNFNGNVLLELNRFDPPAAKPESVYECDLNFISNANVAVPPNSAATLKAYGSIP